MLMVPKIAWMAMLNSLPAYLIVRRFIAPDLTLQLNPDSFRVLRTALYVLGSVTLIGAG